MFSVCSRAQILLPFPLIHSQPTWGGLKRCSGPVRESCLCQQGTAESGLLWPYADDHPFVSGPLSLPIRLLTFNHLLATANLPPFSGECSISFSLLMLVSSSARDHSCIYVSLTDGRWCFQVPRDKRLLSVSKASDSQEDQDKRYDNIYRNMPDSPKNSFAMFFENNSIKL